jgi:hypothetical protein
MAGRLRHWLLGGTMLLASCAGIDTTPASPAAMGDSATDAPREWTGATRQVPSEYPTIQAAVDSADPGDLVLIDRGVYREAVDVATPGLTLRGVDRNEVIIDGEFERANGVQVLFTDGVAVENLTAINHTVNGFFWYGARGFRGSYLTAVNNGDYGIYAFDSGDGLFEHSYASGSPDAAFYIGQCNPCETVLTDSIGEHSGLGYSGTNASTDMYIVNSVFRHNGAGMAPNTLDTELLPPARDVVVAGNLIHDNGYGDFPHKDAQWTTQGNGIILAGVEDTLITRNRIFNHVLNGIQVTVNIDANVWMTSGNTISGNVIDGSGLADLTMTGPTLSGNCFEDNAHHRTMPALLEVSQPCDGLRFPALYELGSISALFGRVVETGLGLDEEVSYQDMRHPGPQPQMPGGAAAPVRPAVDVFASARPDLDTIEVPAMPGQLEITQRKGFDIMGVTFASTIGGFLGLYAYVLPLVLYAAWVVIAIWEITKREDVGRGVGVGWIMAILVLPFVGAIAYYVLGKSQIPVAYRWALLAGGMGAYVLFLVIGMLVGGVV